MLERTGRPERFAMSRPTARLVGLVIASLALLPIACESWQRADLAAKGGPRRPASLERVGSDPDDAEEFARHLLDRSAVLFAGCDATDLSVEGRTIRVVTKLGTREVPTVYGSAVPIAVDGYLLTAAHCIDDAPTLVVATDRDGSRREATARIVWRGDLLDEPIDLAVVHVAGIALPDTAFAPIDEVAPGATIVAAGVGAEWLRLTAGRVLDVRAETTPVPHHVVFVEGPVIPGDSGGPSLLRDRGFVGVATRGRLAGDWIGGMLLRPEEAWLERMIEADRRGRREFDERQADVSPAGIAFSLLDEQAIEAMREATTEP
jgi:S1-C subfamily serine protease